MSMIDAISFEIKNAAPFAMRYRARIIISPEGRKLNVAEIQNKIAVIKSNPPKIFIIIILRRDKSF